ncbi:hypothetical protein GTW40_14345 [Streptomyces sp. SID4985]|nr:hypothetical protein [Streptomyces sp. SID4985]
MTWVLGEPGGEGTGAKRRKRPKHVMLTRVRHRVYRVSPSGTTGRATAGPTTGPRASGWRAGMVVGWG